MVGLKVSGARTRWARPGWRCTEDRREVGQTATETRLVLDLLVGPRAGVLRETRRTGDRNIEVGLPSLENLKTSKY